MKLKKLTEEIFNSIESGKANWQEISTAYELNADFVRKYQDKIWWTLFWKYICYYQKLSEDFIIEFKDKVDWSNISAYQELSEKFIMENYDRIDFKYLLSNKGLVEYSEKLQYVILTETIDFVHKTFCKRNLTLYMKNQYDKLRIML